MSEYPAVGRTVGRYSVDESALGLDAEGVTPSATSQVAGLPKVVWAGVLDLFAFVVFLLLIPIILAVSRRPGRHAANRKRQAQLEAQRAQTQQNRGSPYYAMQYDHQAQISGYGAAAAPQYQEQNPGWAMAM